MPSARRSLVRLVAGLRRQADSEAAKASSSLDLAMNVRIRPANEGWIAKSLACCLAWTLPPIKVNHTNISSQVVPGSLRGSLSGARRMLYQNL